MQLPLTLQCAGCSIEQEQPQVMQPHNLNVLRSHDTVIIDIAMRRSLQAMLAASHVTSQL